SVVATAIDYQFFVFFLLLPRPLRSTLFPYTTLFRSERPMNLQRTRTTWSIVSGEPCSSVRQLSSATFSIASAQHPSSWSSTFQRSEEHTSELQSRENLVCRLLLEKKKKNNDQ